MRQLELNVYNKLKRDFLREIAVLENGIDVLVMYGELLKDQSPYNKPSHTLDDLLKASAEHRRLTTQIMLLNHSIGNMKASRLLLLTGYTGPAMSCLRTSYESFQNAHICSVLDEQAIRFLTGKAINKKVGIPTPNQLEDKIAKDIKRTLSNIGVHPSYKSLENQGYFEGSIFREENRVTYEFLFLRSLYSMFTIQLYLLVYLVEKWPRLIKEIPNVVQVATELRSMIESTMDGIQERAKE
jgi:hypothetical protein